MPSDITRIFVPISDVIKTTVKTSDGIERPARLVRGIMTEEQLDLDQQIVDYDWAKKAAGDWFAKWANIREQHSHNAVGKGKEIEFDDVNRRITLTSKIVDTDAIVKIDEEVYTGYSVGIRGAGVVKDSKAPNGRINRGTIIEDSIVDHPALESAKFAIVKMRKQDGKPELSEGIELLTAEDDAVLNKVAQPDETKLADTDAEKSILEHLAADIDGLNKPDSVPAGKQPAAEPASGTGSQFDVTPESALPRRKKKRLPDASGTAAAKSVTTITITSDDNVDVSEEGDDDDNAVNPLEAAAVEPQAMRIETAVDSNLGGSLKSSTAEITKSEEDIDMLYAKALPQIKDLLTKGDTAAALAVIQATELLTKKVTTEVTPDGTTRVWTEKDPVPAAVATPATPATEPAETTTDKTATPDTLKATISAEVTKAVQTAVSPLTEKVEALEKQVKSLGERAQPGGPMLGGTKLLGAPDEIKAQAVKARIEDVRKMAEEHPDGAVRQGARQILAEFEKSA